MNAFSVLSQKEETNIHFDIEQLVIIFEYKMTNPLATLLKIYSSVIFQVVEEQISAHNPKWRE